MSVTVVCSCSIDGTNSCRQIESVSPLMHLTSILPRPALSKHPALFSVTPRGVGQCVGRVAVFADHRNNTAAMTGPAPAPANGQTSKPDAAI